MTELVRGLIADRPWGLTFGQFGLRQVTGQLTVHALDRKAYCVAFDQGSIVGATSPATADSAIRIALTANLITSSQVSNITRQIAARPGDDEIEVVAAACRLDAMKSLKLRRRVVAQRAARTFSIENGSFVLDDEIVIPTAYDASVDVRAVIYQGARMNLSETRLLAELRDLGSQFTLGDTAMANADWFGFELAEREILEALRGGTTLAELEAKRRDLDPRNVQSVIYALVACREVKLGGPPVARTASRDVSVSFKGGDPAAPRAPIASGGSGSIATPRSATRDYQAKPVVELDSRQKPPAPVPDARLRTPTKPLTNETRLPATKAAPHVEPAIEPVGLPGLEEEPTASRNLTGRDLGPPAMPEFSIARTTTARTALPSTAPPMSFEEPTIRAAITSTGAPPAIEPPAVPPPSARPPRAKTASTPPLRTRSPSTPPTAPPVSPPLRAKPSTLPPGLTKEPSSPVLRPKSTSIPPPVSVPRTISQNPTGAPSEIGGYSEGTDRVRQSIGEAAEQFKRGQEAIRDGKIDAALEPLSRAATLNPHEFDYSALLAWAQLMVASPADRPKSADKVRKMLSHSIQKSREPEQARIYLGQMERLLGRDKEALALFGAVLAAVPDHPQALAEIQATEDKQTEKAGFSLFRKK